MPLPVSITEMLANQNVNYNIASVGARMNNLTLIDSSEQTCIAQALLLEDSRGQVQVLIPVGTMVDLEALQQQTGRRLEGVSMSYITPLLQQHNVACIPAMPRWQGMQTIVEHSLMTKPKLWLEVGAQGDLLELTQADFQNFVTTSEIAKFAIKIPTLSSDTKGDEIQIFDSIKQFTQKRIRQRLDETLEMPPLPETAQRIIKLRADPDADINDLANIVEIDPSLAAQVVSWAASPYYSAPGKIKSVHDAIVRVLGFDMVLNLSLGLALGKTMTMQTLSPAHIAEYWRNAVYTAAVVEGLVTSIDRRHRPGFGMAYLSGLLYNFGYMVMAEIFPPYFQNIERMAKANMHVPKAAIEQHLLGVTGNQVAAWLMDNWNMPIEVVVGLRQQHNLKYEGEYAVYAKLVHLAQMMLANAGYGNALARPIPSALFQELHLDEETARITTENILESGEDLDLIAEKMRS